MLKRFYYSRIIRKKERKLKPSECKIIDFGSLILIPFASSMNPLTHRTAASDQKLLISNQIRRISNSRKDRHLLSLYKFEQEDCLEQLKYSNLLLKNPNLC